MQSFFNRFRSQSNPKTPLPTVSDSSSGSAQVVEQPRGDAPPFEFTGIRKIHPNQDELLASTSQAPFRASSPQKEPDVNVLGVRQPSTPARIANRRDPPSVSPVVEEPMEDAGELERSQESSQSPSRSSTSRRPNLSLFSAVPFSGAADWSTFGRRNKTRQVSPPSREDDRTSPKNVSRTSSQSRTTPSRTPRTKNSTLSRSNSTKQPASIEQSSYSRIPASAHDNHENSSPQNTEDGVSPPNAQSLHSTPSTPSFQRLSVFSHAAPHDQIDSTYPPRTSVLKEETQASSSLPFTFGRQPPKRPTTDNLFPSEFGDTRRETSIQEENSQDMKRSSVLWVSKEASAPGGSQWPSKVAEEMIRLSLAPPSHTNPPSSEPFPKTESPSTEYPTSQPHAPPRRHVPTDSDPYSSISDDMEGSRHQVPSLISDHSQSHTADAGSTTKGWPFDPSLPHMPSFGASGDELSNPHVASSSTLASSQASRIRSPNEERRRIRSASSSSGMKLAGNRLSGDPLKDKSKSAGLLPTIAVQPPVTVYTNLVPNTQDFPKTEDPAPTTSEAQNQPGSSRVDTNVPPALAVTAPTPQASPARSQADQLAQLFAQRSVRVPSGHAHASGIGVAGVEPHSRRQSLKVMGKRKAGEASEEDEVTVYEGKSNRPRFDSNAPSSYHRKRMKLSSDASEKDALPLRVSHSASRSGAASTHSMTSSKPETTGRKSRRNLSPNASMVSVPVSAIVTPRAPSVHHSVSGMSRRSDGFRYQDPLKNRVQHRARQEVWADSWILDRDEMPIQAWLFLVGFLIAPCWWIGALLPIRHSHPIEEGKGKNVPSVGLAARSNSGLWADATEWDEARARMWRFRCFVATIISTLAYVPIIACAVVFSRK
ncbi:hypothetical protein CPB86DRAFT_828230 [Serendipita vermifera]|nr:hypothetical protein CPB86DRAFT_828230 [Serendipita vermifera]